MIDGLKPYADRRDSGLPWLGEIPVHWDTKRTRYLFREVDARSEFGEETQLSMSQVHGLVESSKIDTWRMRSESYAGGKLCQPGDLVLNRLKAHLGVFASATIGGVISPDYSVFRPQAGANARYFEKVLKTPQCVGEIRRFTKGIVEGFWRLYTDDFYNLTLPSPPPDEQAAIVRFLDHADRRIRRYIRAKRQLIALLNEQKQAIIHRAVTRGVDRHAKLKPSGVEWLGDVPEYWSIKRLKYVVPSVTVGIVVQPARLYVEVGVPCLRSLNISKGVINRENLVYISEENNNIHRKSQVRAGDIVVVRTGAAGAAVIVPDEFDRANCIDLLIARQSRRMTSKYLLLFLRSHAAKCDVEYESVGAIQSHYNTSTLANLRLPIPPLAEQDVIIANVDGELGVVEAAIARANQECDLLREYRTSLIADVATGKFDVREAVAALPDELKEVEPDATELLDEDETIDDAELDIEPEEIEA